MASELTSTMRGVLRDDLARAAEELRLAEAEVERAKAHMRAIILRAQKEGIPIASIARWTKRTRETIYRDIERARREEE